MKTHVLVLVSGAVICGLLGFCNVATAQTIERKLLQFTAGTNVKIIEVRSSNLVVYYDKDQSCFSKEGGKVGVAAKIGGSVTMDLKCRQGGGSVTARATGSASYASDTLALTGNMTGRSTDGTSFRQSYDVRIRISGSTCSGSHVVTTNGRRYASKITRCKVSNI